MKTLPRQSENPAGQMKVRRGIYPAIIQALVAMSIVIAGGLVIIRPDLSTILLGEPFVYAAIVDVTPRAVLSLFFVAFMGLWLFLRHLQPWLGLVRPLAMLGLSVACCISSVIHPVAGLGQPAYTHSELRHDGRVYRLFYIYPEITARQCWYVLVACDGLGFMCQRQTEISSGALCLGNQANYALQIVDHDVVIVVDGELIVPDVTPAQ